TRFIPASTRSSWSRNRASISPRTPESAPTAPAATRATSSKNRFWLCIALTSLRVVIPAKAGIQGNRGRPLAWIPAFAGMTPDKLLRRRLALAHAARRLVLIDRLLDRRSGAAGEIDVAAGGVVIAAPQQVAALLEMRVHKPRHQFVMLFRGVPIGPVLCQFA